MKRAYLYFLVVFGYLVEVSIALNYFVLVENLIQVTYLGSSTRLFTVFKFSLVHEILLTFIFSISIGCNFPIIVLS